ncbi:MAG: ATP-binding protein [Desulfobacterales bacterium]|jgi:lon-related putative ATP-dependent protease|nr:ATP-binding protein [Desulfobacterales bacterium]
MPEMNRLAVCDLRSNCSPDIFLFKHTGEIDPLADVIGQERAVQAIEFGLNMESPGYNIFVTGIEGTGKNTIVKDLVTKFARNLPTPMDWCLVNNFNDVYRPVPIAVPSGKATRFCRAVQKVVDDVTVRLPKEFESKPYTEKLKEITESFNREKAALTMQLDEAATEKRIVITKGPAGYQPVPLFEGKPMTTEFFQTLSAEKKAEIEAELQAFNEKIDSAMTEIRKISYEQQKRIDTLVQETTLFVLSDRMASIRNQYRDSKDILNYLDEMKSYISENIETILPESSDDVESPDRSTPPMDVEIDPFKVNVLVDHRFSKGAPVIYEPNPTYANLFGSIEKKAIMGMLTTDYTMVQAGSLLRANGGYLILEIESVLQNGPVWEALKRALQNKLLYIEDAAVGMGIGTASLRPEPIPLEVKVVLLGSYEIFQMLQDNDSKFNKIFRVRADFDHETQCSEATMQQYAKFVARVCREEKLKPVSAEGVAAIVEFGKKAVAHRDKLSLRFGPVVGIIKEADYWARRDNARIISEQHVVTAFNQYRFRYNLYEEKIQESYTDNSIMIDVAGEKVGQVNALAVFTIGDISFGRPSRITAETFMGKHGIINIEREADLSGRTHDKGVLILSGYLGRTFAQQYPLCLSISIAFEQSYIGIDGDSASSTELYAILSSLSGIPIRQGVAVTGSVNQKGEIQAIGGVNQKIEGFFDVCKAKGLTGKQGVIIPKANVKNLMLRKEVVEAAEKEMFHVYPAATIEEGIEMLTGIAAGTPNAKGVYPSDSLYGLVQKKLFSYLEQSLKYQMVMV